ncbi:MAG: TonB-dependent receptor [Acidobacteria bacterium]|nr:TonB-dependent receptor [Acidobacteriota bacterium]MCB9397061.1 TonB-dependent receptor [Acidobacteriota bacterium]
MRKLILLGTLSLFGLLWAGTTGNIRVVISDSGGQPLPGATVTAATQESLTKRSGVTDGEGTLMLASLDPSAKYEVTVIMPGFNTIKQSGVLVRTDRTTELRFELKPSTVEEVMTVTADNPVVDTTSAIVGQDITLELTESLPTARSYQSYLQLAPGTKPSSGGNPSSKGGVNYSDIGGNYGNSTDNFYYIDGVNITDNTTGTFGANFNSEIIQEQTVITGGAPAEFAGSAGLLSRVVTKSGGNSFAGSLNYYFQNDSLVDDNEHIAGNDFNTYDTAFTLGGPILKDKVWFYVSYQLKNREDDVYAQSDNSFLRSVTTDQDFGFAKLTWQMSANDKLALQFFNDPYDRDGSTSSTTLNNRDTARKQGGDNYKLEYSHYFGNLIWSSFIGKHEAQLSNIPADTSTRNNIIFNRSVSSTLAERSLGGAGRTLETQRDREFIDTSLDYSFPTSYGLHNIKFGINYEVPVYYEESQTLGDGALYTSLDNQFSGTSLEELTRSGNWTTGSISNDDVSRILSSIESSSDRAYFTGLLDTNGDGSVSAEEIRAYQFTSSQGNPDGAINVYRSFRSTNNPYEVKSKGISIYLQDQWSYGQWTVNAGIRAEQWKHFASDGSEIFTFDFELAPRLSVAYDILKDGRMKATAFYGRFYDPVRNNMTDFAGALTGPVDEEQVYLGDRWLTYRTRGGSVVLDSIFAPSTKTPYTDQIMLGYAADLGHSMSLEFQYTHQDTTDILEDYDYNLYLNAGDFALGPEYYGITDPATLSALENHEINYIIGTLKGGERKYNGYELVFRKRMSNNWQLLSSYTYNDAKGNSNSDSNADFQGDWVALDPRAPNIYGPQPGNIKHLLKMAGSYRFQMGLELGASYLWNSGTLYSRTFSLYGRNLPLMQDDVTTVGNYEDTWVLSDVVGKFESPAYGTLDMRIKYTKSFSQITTEFFLDIFNALDDQAVTREQDLAAGDGVTSFGEGTSWVDPRRYYIGARISF